MIGFLTPLAFFALALLAIPVLLHIFKPRRVREMPFSSLRWLRTSQHRMSKKIRWHQVFLLMLRMAFIIALVAALAHPILFSWEGVERSDRFVVLDVSPGMGYDPLDDDPPLRRAKEAARELVSHTSPGDRATVLKVGAGVRAVGPMTGDPDPYLNEVEASRVEAGGSNLTDVLEWIQPLRGRDSQAEAIDLVFITDSTSQKWSHSQIASFMEDIDKPVHVRVIDVSPDLVQNAWIAGGELIERRSPAQRFIRVRAGATGADSQRRTIRLSGLPGLPDQQREVVIEPGSFEQAVFELPTDYELQGRVATVELTPRDNLPGDDLFWINLDASATTRVLVIEPEITQVAELQPGFHLRTALRALGDSISGGLEVVRVTPEAVSPEEISGADAVVMVDVPELAGDRVRALEERVREGAGLAVFLGPSVDPGFYNQQMHDPLRPEESLLSVTIGEAVQEQAFSRINRMDTGHSIFRGLLDPVYGDLDDTQFTAYYRLQPSDSVESARELAYIGATTPAILERSLGLGRVLLINATANDAWTDLPRRRSYVPLVDRMVRHLVGGIWQGSFAIGTGASIPLPADADQDSVTVRTPGGTEISPPVQMIAGRSVIRLQRLSEPGVYTVGFAENGTPRSFPFVVQADDTTRLPGRIDEETLQAWWSPADVQMVRYEPGTDLVAAVTDRRSLVPWLLALAAFFFALEMFFVHWLCPRANPALSQSALSQSGFFRRQDTGRDSSPPGGDPVLTPAAERGAA